MPNPPNHSAQRRALLQHTVAVGATLFTFRAAAQAVAPKPALKPASAASATPLSLPPLPYPANALEPHISAQTLSFHHGKHHKAYFDKTNELLQGTPLQGKSLEEVVKGSAKNKAFGKLFNNAAQAWNHNIYWKSMKPKGGGAPPADLKDRIDRDFGSFDNFKSRFIQTAVDHFSNGWVWLVLEGGKIKIVDTHDADTPLARGQKALLVSDVWEHAYYLDYKNARKDYATAFVERLLNWDYVRENLAT